MFHDPSGPAWLNDCERFIDYVINSIVIDIVYTSDILSQTSIGPKASEPSEEGVDPISLFPTNPIPALAGEEKEGEKEENCSELSDIL